MEEDNKYKSFAFYAIFLVAAYLFYLMIKPYATFVLLGIMLAIATHPLYQKIFNKTRKKSLSAFLAVLLVLIIVIIPAIIILTSLISETVSFFRNMDINQVNSLAKSAEDLLGIESIQEQVNKAVIAIGQYSVNIAVKVVTSVSDAVIGVFLMISILYYAFIDGEKWVEKSRKILPFSRQQQDHLFHKIKSVTRSVMFGELLISLTQGFLGGLVFYILGISNPAFWGFMMALLAFLPFVGSGMIWAPAAAIKIYQGDITSGIFLLIYGFAIIGGIDYFMRPKIVSNASSIHPLTALLGAFGGLKLFGFIGLILGPLIAAILEAIIRFHVEEQEMEEERRTEEKAKNSIKQRRNSRR